MYENCKKDIKFNEASSRGLGFKIAVSCECGVSYVNSGPMIGKEYATERDVRRINHAELGHKASSKEGRTARRKALASQQALFEEEEGPLYGPGIAD